MKVAKCVECGRLTFPTHRVCSRCRGTVFEEADLKEGRVLTHTVLHVPPPDLTPPIPIAIVEFEGGVRALGQVTEPVEIGARVVPDWGPLREVDGATCEGFRFRPR
ncbi:MAG: Zn-ribbon domain-containing OB-fold protein [Thermoplasmata archaeon]